MADLLVAQHALEVEAQNRGERDAHPDEGVDEGGRVGRHDRFEGAEVDGRLPFLDPAPDECS